MVINFSTFKTNAFTWINRQYHQLEKEFKKKNSSEYEGIIKKEQLTLNNYIQSLIDDIHFSMRKDLKGHFEFKEARNLYEEYKVMTNPLRFSLMEYKADAMVHKDSVFERVPAKPEKDEKEKQKSIQKNKEQNIVIGASVGGLLGAGFGFKAVNPLMFKMVATPAGLVIGALVGGYIALQLLPGNDKSIKTIQNAQLSTNKENQTYREAAASAEFTVKEKSIEEVLQERKIQVERKLDEMIDHMEQNYKNLLAGANR